MPVTTVTVEYVNQPKPGRKQGSIKTASGQYIGVWPEKLSAFQPGGTYEIEYDSETGQNGKTYHQLKKIINGAAGGLQTVSQVARRVTGMAGGSSDQSEKIFVTGIIGRSLHGTGTIPDEDTLTDWVVRARAAWARGFAAAIGPVATKPLGEELNDEIPF